MHHFVSLSGIAAVLLAVWVVQLAVLALHLRYTIRYGVNDPATQDSEFALVTFGVIATLISAIGGGSAFGAGLHATAWGWAQAILAVGTTTCYLLLTYATGWDAKTWWAERKTGTTGHTDDTVESAA